MNHRLQGTARCKFAGLGAVLASVLASAFLALLVAAPVRAATKTKNVVLIVMDGLRWQEMFTGADPTLLNEKYGGMWQTEDEVKGHYWRR